MVVRALSGMMTAGLVLLGSPSTMANEIPRLDRTPGTPDEWLVALQGHPALALRQSWRVEPEPGLSPGQVWVVQDATRLHVFARLEDRDIFSGATTYNQRLFELGDVFEVFLQPKDSLPYWEIHASPTGVTYQARFDSAAGFALRRRQGLSLEALLQPYLLAQPVAEVQAWPRPAEGAWYARISLPLEFLGEAQHIRLSAARYDASREGAAPVLSCSSPLTKLDFHRLEEFTTFLIQRP